MDRTVCTEPQYSYNSTSPMGRTACTEPQYSYTSTPPMGRTACTEPQCLYKGAFLLLFELSRYKYILQFQHGKKCKLLAQTSWL